VNVKNFGSGEPGRITLSWNFASASAKLLFTRTMKNSTTARAAAWVRNTVFPARVSAPPKY